MKKLLTLLLAAALLLAALPASAAVSAMPTMNLALRTGPNTKYVELYTLPQSTRITAYEYESGNDVTWVLIEYTYNGEVCRGYTGLKRMNVNGSIPWASHINETATISSGGSVLAAPNGRAAYRGRVDAGERVTLLDYEGSYAFIEFYDAANGAPSRGYVESWQLGSGGGFRPGLPDWNSGGVSATPNQSLAFRTGPNTKYVELYTLPQSTRITAYEYENGNGVTWVLVEFTYEGQTVRGYTGLKRMSVNGSIPWADHIYASAWPGYTATVYAAPSFSAAYRGTVYPEDRVTLLDYDGDFAYIEFYDYANGAPSRGYVPADALN